MPMAVRVYSASWIAAVMVTAVLSSMLIPVCVMPECGDTNRRDG
jgi:hypothetical protein